MSNATGAEGGYAAPLPKWSTESFDQEGAEDPVQQPPDPTLGPEETNRGPNIDITKVANDEADDGDYDDPYPGGDTPSIGIPADG